MVMMETYLVILLKIFGEINCTIKVFLLFNACWIMHSCIPQKYRATLIIFISFYINSNIIKSA